MDLYRGRVAALGTKHGKERAVAPPLARRLGLSVAVPDVDTDRLGTFTGEVERPGTPKETVLMKARAAAEAAGVPLALASEGSFGPHPSLPWLPCGQELLAFIDLDRGLTVVESRVTLRTTHGQVTGRALDGIAGFLSRIGFPRQAVIVRPNAGDAGDGSIVKGLSEPAALARALDRAAAASVDGLARIETDMRAHLNPVRMGEIRKVAARLARRLATPCPSCGSPGFGAEGPVPGLPCGWCGGPTGAALGERWHCQSCGHGEVRPHPHRPTVADPGQCPDCNP